jgi:hypothetical protein
MTAKIKIITPPDKLFDKANSIFLIHPGQELKREFNEILAEQDESVNVYMFEKLTDEDVLDYEWLLSVANMVGKVILDVDKCYPVTRNFTSYLISLPNVYYITNDTTTPYKLISDRQIYNLDILKKGGHVV